MARTERGQQSVANVSMSDLTLERGVAGHEKRYKSLWKMSVQNAEQAPPGNPRDVAS